jgi:hypothetical protein
MAEITGGTRVPGLITPTDTNDTYAVIDPIYGIDGLRNVTSIAEMNAIPNNRRRTGMQVGVTTGGTSGGTVYFILKPEPWSATTEDWVRTFEIKSGETYYNVLHITELYGSSPISVKDSLHMGENVAFTSTTNVQDVFIIGNNNKTTEYLSGATDPSNALIHSEGFNGTDWHNAYAAPLPNGWSFKTNGVISFFNDFTAIGSTPNGTNWFGDAAYEGDGAIEFVDENSGQEITFEYSGISTVGLTDVNVSWYAARYNASFPQMFFEASNDGTNWTGITFTDVANDSTYHEVTVTLPSHMLEESLLRFRYKFTNNNSFQRYTIDAFNINYTVPAFSGTPAVGLYDDGLIIGSNNVASAQHLSGFTIFGDYITANTSDTIYINRDIRISDISKTTFDYSGTVMTIGDNGNVEYSNLVIEQGLLTASTGDNSAVLINGGNVASGTSATAFGTGNTASGDFSFVEGKDNIAYTNNSHAEGWLTTASGDTSHAEGRETTATGDNSHTEGWYSKALGSHSHAEGYNTTASGSYAHAEGNQTIAGNESHAEGSRTSADSGSHAEGQLTRATGSYSHAQGARTTANGNYSHAEGYLTTSSDYASHAEGNDTIASGSTSHAEGASTTAGGYAAHAQNGNTLASGDYSHSGGYAGNGSINVVAGGFASFVHFHNTPGIGGTDLGAYGDNSAILGGTDHNLEATAARSVILGGANITAISADTVYVPKLNIGTVNPTTINVNLGIDENGFVVTGDTASDFTGNTSATCITDLYVSNIYGCSPVNMPGSLTVGFDNTLTVENSFSLGYDNKVTGGTVSHTFEKTFVSGTTVQFGEPVFNTGLYNFSFPGDVATEWTSYINYGGTSLTLYGGTGATEPVIGTLFVFGYDGGTDRTYVWYNPDTPTNDTTFTFISGTTIDNTNTLDTTYGSFALGYQNVVTGNYGAYAQGRGNKVSGTGTHAQGYYTTASANYAHAEGYQTVANGAGSHAEGNCSTTCSVQSHAEGFCTTTRGNYSHAEGCGTRACGCASHAEGLATGANGCGSHAEGCGTLASGWASHAEGQATLASGDYSHAEGHFTTAIGTHSHAEGGCTTACGQYSHAQGRSTVASGSSSHASGYLSKAYGAYSHAEGQGTTASGATSHAEGRETKAIGLNSHAEGFCSYACGDYSHAEGNFATAIGLGAHVEGVGTVASEQSSHAEGSSTTALGAYSHSEGVCTTACGIATHAEGQQTTASGNYSHSEGFLTTAGAQYSHSEGYSTTSNGLASHAGGFCTRTQGFYSFIHATHSAANGYQSAILGGSGHTIGSTVDNSVILGGTDITALSADTVYVPKLNITELNNTTISVGLGLDENGYVVSGSTGGSSEYTIVNDGNTTYNLSNSDFDNIELLRMTASSANIVVIPNDTTLSSVNIGANLSVTQNGTGQTTISGGTGVTLQSADGADKLRTQHSTGTIIKVGNNTWLLSGDITV